MIKITSIASIFMIAIYTLPAIATEKNNWYIGGLYSAQSISLSKTERGYVLPKIDRDLTTAGIVVGYNFNQNFSFEASYSKGASGVSLNLGNEYFPDDSLDADIDYQRSLIVKASYPFTDDFDFYITVGFSETKVEIDILSGAISVPNQYATVPISPSWYREDFHKHTYIDSGLNYGLGFNYSVTTKINLYIGYQVLPDWSRKYYAEDWDSINMGLNYEF